MPLLGGNLRGTAEALTLPAGALAVSLGLFGIFVALGASRLIATLLYGLRPTDPLTIAAATLLMIAAAGLAGYLPARRASYADPMVALRYE